MLPMPSRVSFSTAPSAELDMRQRLCGGCDIPKRWRPPAQQHLKTHCDFAHAMTSLECRGRARLGPRGAMW